jgi:hypothetical protein
MATSFISPQTGLKSWEVFVSIRKGECRCVLISGRTLDEAWKTLQLDPEDVVMGVCEKSPLTLEALEAIGESRIR